MKNKLIISLLFIALDIMAELVLKGQYETQPLELSIIYEKTIV